MNSIFIKKVPLHGLIILLILMVNTTLAQTEKKYKLVWQDEFNYKGLPDPAKWRYEQGFTRNAEPQYYTSNRLKNCRVENGVLVIEAIKEPFKGPGKGRFNARDTFAAYTSASIYTQGIKSWKYGRVEVRAKVPKGKGSWSAAWLLGDNHGVEKWPQCGEIDLMEYVGKDSSKVYQTVHYADSTGRHRSRGQKPVVGDPSDGFHNYAIEWDQDHITFFYDDKAYFNYDLKNSDIANDNPFRKKFYLILNLALGRQGTLGGVLDDNILPLRYEVDYVRVYQ